MCIVQTVLFSKLVDREAAKLGQIWKTTKLSILQYSKHWRLINIHEMMYTWKLNEET